MQRVYTQVEGTRQEFVGFNLVAMGQQYSSSFSRGYAGVTFFDQQYWTASVTGYLLSNFSLGLANQCC